MAILKAVSKSRSGGRAKISRHPLELAITPRQSQEPMTIPRASTVGANIYLLLGGLTFTRKTGIERLHFNPNSLIFSLPATALAHGKPSEIEITLVSAGVYTIRAFDANTKTTFASNTSVLSVNNGLALAFTAMTGIKSV